MLQNFVKLALIALLLVSISKAAVTITRGGAPVSDGDTINVTRGDDLVFVCMTSDTAADISLMTTPNVPFDASPIASTRTFNVSNVQQNGVVFACTDNSDTTSFSINVQFPPTYEFSEAQYSGMEGNPLTVNVSVDANPLPTDVTWRRNGADVQDSGITTTLTSISFNTLSRNFGGTYTVQSDNGIGDGSASFELTVYFDIEFANAGSNVNVPVGDMFTINCTLSSSGSNPPAVEVYILMPDGTRVNSTILTVQVSQSNDGVYTCFASTSVQNVTLIYSITATAVVTPTSTAATDATSSSAMMPSVTVMPSESPSSIGFRYSVSIILILLMAFLAFIFV